MSENILEVRHLKKYFPTKRGLLHAVDDVNFSIKKGTTMGLVGESGCGKSTVGRLILRLTEATDGEILFYDDDIRKYDREKMRHTRRRLQIVFQDPYASLDGRKSIFESIAEPLQVQKIYQNKKEMEEKVYELMATAGLARRLANSYPHELDGGRRQRVGIARALALNPDFLVLDEPVSALDVSIQAQVLNLMEQLQEQMGLTYLFISHDLSVVKHISDEIAVMYLGNIVEVIPGEDVTEHAVHPYTQALLGAQFSIHMDPSQKIQSIESEAPSPLDVPKGCPFQNRCENCTDRCKAEMPKLKEIAPGHEAACFYVEEHLKN